MTKRTRLFVSIAAGILVVGLGTGLLASYASLENISLFAQDGPSELEYVPADTHMVAYANVREVMDSELRRKIEATFAGDSGRAREEFKEATGVNLESDVDEIVVAGQGTGHPLLVVSGRFDVVRIEGVIRERGGQVSEYSGKRLLTFSEGTQDVALAFAEPGLLVMGPATSVRGALDTKASGADVRDNADVMRLVRDVENGNAWAVARFDDVSGRTGLPPELAGQLPQIAWFAVSGTITDGVTGTLHAEARDEAQAQNLRQVVQGLLALGRMQAGQHPAIGELLNSLAMGGDGKTVSLAFTLPAELIDTLGAIRAERRQESQDSPDSRTPETAPPANPTQPTL